MTAQKKALIVFGIKNQLRKLAEECAELAVAALHMADEETPENREALCEEIADVEIVIDGMRLHFGEGEIERWRSRKLTRLEKRLGISEAEFHAGRPDRGMPRAGEKGREKAPKKEAPKKQKLSGRSGGSRAPVELWINGEHFQTALEAKKRFGAGISLVVSKRLTHWKGMTISYASPEPVL